MWLALRPIILEESSVQLYNVKLGSTAELPYLGLQNKISHINFQKDNDEQKVPVSWITKHTLLFILSFL
jgi:hypothetical protein